MAATLRLRLDLHGSGAWDGVVANLYALSGEGHRLHERDQRSIIIPAGEGVSPLAVSIQPGHYIVEAVLPSGDVVRDQVHVAEGEESEVALEAPRSPNEWLSWQQFIGNVPAVQEVEQKKEGKRGVRQPSTRPAASQVERIEQYLRRLERDDARPGSKPGTGRSARSSGGTPSGSCFGRGGGRDVASRPGGRTGTIGGTVAIIPRRSGGMQSSEAGTRTSRPTAWPWPAIWFIRHPVEALGGEGKSARAWHLLGEPPRRKATLEALARRAPTKSEHQFEQREWRRYAFGGDGDLGPGEGETAGGDQLPRRYLVAIRARGPIEIASLPVPWDSGPHGQVPVELLVRRDPLPGEAMVALSPQDPWLRSAIGYLGAGSLANAQLMFDKARDMLFGKMINPLGAAAGGYVLLATELDQTEQYWHSWIRNLANWFEWLPDGMVQYGRLRLNRRRGEADVKEARQAFFTAFDRGIPFYSLGLQWLVDGLSLLATGDDHEAAERLAAVQRVAWRANLQQPFTTIRLHDR